MAPTRKRGSKVSTAIARKEWDVGDLVMAKVKGFPAWPAQVSRAQEFNQTPNPSRVFVYFFGTQQIRFCLHTEISDFTPEVRAALTTKCQSKGTIADLRLAVKEICEADDEIRAAQCKQNHNISNEEGESLHSLRSSSENKELQKHLEVEDEVGLEESNIKEEIFAPINDLVKDGPGTGYVADGGNITKVLDGGKSSKTGKDGKSGNIYRVSKQEAEGIRHNLTSHSVEKNNDQDASGGRTRAELGKCEKRVAELGTKSFQNAQTQSLEGNKETVNMQKGDFEPVVKTGSQNSHGFDNGILHTNFLGVQKKKAKNRVKEPAKDQAESSIENLAKCSGKGEKRSPIKLDVAHDGQQEVMKSTESSTGLIRVGNVSTNFAAHEGLEVDDFEYADSDYKRAQEGLTSRAHQFLQQQQDAGKSLDFFVSRPVKHKGNDQKPKLSGETSGVYGKVKHTDKQHTVHASPISKHDEGTKLERRKIDDSGNIESHISNKNEQGLYSKATHDVSFEKDKAFVKRRKLVDSQVTVKIQLATAYKETKLAGDASGTPVSQKLKKVVRDSDEHLPLVKRARARGHGEYIKSISDDQSPVLSQERQSMQDQEHFEFAERVKLKRNAPLNADAVSAEQQLQQFEGRNLKFEETGQGSLPLKADKHRIRSTLFDGEAALPPSKRRQRALEAMTACVAEAASIETDKVKQRDEQAENQRSSSPVKQPASTGDIAIKGIITRNVNEAVCDVSPLSRKSAAGVQQNKDDVAVEMLGRESAPKVETFFGLHHFDVATETKPVTGQGNVVSHTFLKVQESGDASKLRSPILEGKTKGKNQNLIITNELSNNTSARHNSGLESMPTLKVPESSIREHAATSAPRSVIANTQPKTFVSQARPFSSMSQDIGRNDGGSPNIQLEEKDKNVREAYEVAKEIKQRMFLKEKDSSLLSTSMKYLIAAAQAKRPIRSQGAGDLVPLESERLPIFLASSPSSRYERGDVRPDSPIQQYPVHLQAEAFPANEAGACSERYKVNVSGDKREDFQIGNRHAECGEDASQNLLSYEEQEAAIARDALEGMLETLSRTKDSIGRVTRHAIDCAKFGIAEQVVEVIVRKLEDEHSFRRRVDLFFLLDSITQCSVKDKGVAEATYPPAVQAALPRLLKAAAPPGNNARENRRQCLKVLNLWLERNILPAQVIRQFMNGIEAHDADKGLVSMGPHPSRNERAIDDPLREMEGIVDEYGSNAGYALPGFFVPRIFDDDDDEGNECVQKADKSAFEDMCHHELGDNKDEKTEQSMKGFLNNDSKSSFEVGRHRHFLEDVDGELEMEDVSPIADDFRARGEQMEDNSPWSTSVEVAVSSTEMISQPPLPSAVPPSPICPPPSPPPLPMSPPPSPPPPPASPPPTMVAQPPIADTGFANIAFKVASVPTQQSFNTLPSSGGPNLFSSFEQVRSAESVTSRFETAFDHYSQQHLVPGLMQPSIQSIKPNIGVERTFNSPPNFVVTQIPPPPKFSMHLSSSYIPISEPQKPLPSVTPLIQTMHLENVNTLQQCYAFPPLPSPQSQGKTSGLIGEVPYGLQQPWSAMLPPSGLEKEHVMMPRVQDQQWEVLHRDHGWEKVQDQICFSEYASQGVVLNAASSKSKLMEGEKSGGGFHPVAYQPTGINTYPPELVNGFTGPRQGQGFQSIPPGLPLPTVAGSVPWVPYSGSSNMESLFSQSTGLPGLPAEKSAPTPQARLQLPGFRACIPSSNLWRPL